MFSSGNLLIIILPLVALIMAGLSVAGLWLWWDMSREKEEGPARRPEPAPTESPEPGADVTPAAAVPAEGESGGWLSKIIGDDEPEPASAPASPPSPSQASPSQPVSTSPPPAAGDAVEVFRIYRDLADGALVVEIQGQRYRSLGEITDAQVGRRFLGNVKALAHFARLGDVEIPDEWAAEALSAPAGGSPAPSSSREESPASSQSEGPGHSAPPPPPSVHTSPPAAQPPESTSFLGGLFGGRGATSAEPEEVVDARPMAEQIEELLQYRLMGSPDLRHRSIHVRSSADGGVRIEVDGRFYDGVGDVEDAEVRAFIQSIIQEWEARQ